MPRQMSPTKLNVSGVVDPRSEGTSVRLCFVSRSKDPFLAMIQYHVRTYGLWKPGNIGTSPHLVALTSTLMYNAKTAVDLWEEKTSAPVYLYTTIYIYIYIYIYLHICLYMYEYVAAPVSNNVRVTVGIMSGAGRVGLRKQPASERAEPSEGEHSPVFKISSARNYIAVLCSQRSWKTYKDCGDWTL